MFKLCNAFISFYTGNHLILKYHHRQEYQSKYTIFNNKINRLLAKSVYANRSLLTLYLLCILQQVIISIFCASIKNETKIKSIGDTCTVFISFVSITSDLPRTIHHCWMDNQCAYILGYLQCIDNSQTRETYIFSVSIDSHIYIGVLLSTRVVKFLHASSIGSQDVSLSVGIDYSRISV